MAEDKPPTKKNHKEKEPTLGQLIRGLDVKRIRFEWGFVKHLFRCKDGICRSLVLHVELPYRARWLFVGAVGYFASQGRWGYAAFSALTAVTMSLWGFWAGRLISYYIDLAEKKRMVAGIQGLLGKMAKAVGGQIEEIPGGFAMGIPLGQQQEDEDPIDRLIRESNAEFERKKRGDKPLS
jgi:hypothetical protein